MLLMSVAFSRECKSYCSAFSRTKNTCWKHVVAKMKGRYLMNRKVIKKLSKIIWLFSIVVQEVREGHQEVALEEYILIFDLLIYETFSNDTVSIMLFKKKVFVKEYVASIPR